MSLGASSNYHFKSGTDTTLFTIGLGLGYHKTFLDVTSIIAIEYRYNKTKSLSLSLFVIKEIVYFNSPCPPLISTVVIF